MDHRWIIDPYTSTVSTSETAQRSGERAAAKLVTVTRVIVVASRRARKT
jgi:hypothetical protein